MSTTAVAAPIVVDGPAPRERVHSLLTVPGVLQSALEDHWRAGVGVWGYPEEVPELWEGCSAGTFRTKVEGGQFSQAVFTSFVIYESFLCSARGNVDELGERAEAVLKATQAFAVEKALSQGIPGQSPANPFLGDANLSSLASGVSARIALSHLDDAIGQTGRQGLIHLTPAVANAADSFLERDDPTAPIYTTAGSPVAIGAGYIGTDPVNLASPGATSDWVFATGPVEVRIEDAVTVLPATASEAVDQSNNDVVYRAEKVAVVSWDTALQVAVLVDWTL